MAKPVASHAMNTIAALEAADRAYQACEPSPMTDHEFDELARQHGFQPYASHEFPSLQNAICVDELRGWLTRFKHHEHYFHAELKTDGVSVVIENGTMRSRKLNLTPLLPSLNLPKTVTMPVRGELWHPRGRNYASGRIRALDTTAGLRFMPFCRSLPDRSLLLHRGLEVSPWAATTTSADDLIDYWEEWKAGAICPDMPSDGLVVTAASPAVRERLGVTPRHPNWAIALKRA